MCISSENNDRYEQCVLGEEFHIFDVDDIFLDISKSYFSAELQDTDFLLHNIGSNSGFTGSLILSLDEAPTRTKRSTIEIMSEFKQENGINYRFAKELSIEYFDKRHYCSPYMTKSSLWAPLEGESKGNVDFVNVSLLNSVKPYYSNETILSVINRAEIVLPRGYSSASERLERYLENYVVFSYAMFLLNNEEGVFTPFSKWRGNCWKKYEYLIQKVQSSLSKKRMIDLKMESDIRNEKSESRVGELLNIHYNHN